MLTVARAVSFAIDDAGCPPGAKRRSVVDLEAFDRQGRFVPDGGLPRLLVYRSNMVPGTVQGSDLTVTSSPQGTNANLRVQSCGPESVTMLVVGYAFEGGNGVCVALTP